MQHKYLEGNLRLDTSIGLEDAKHLLLGVPFDGSSSFLPGSRFAPTRIREAFLESEHDQYGGDLWEVLCDAGNVSVAGGDVEETLRRVREVVSYLRSVNPEALLHVLGGEHLISLPLVEALKDEVDAVVCLDAHLDLRDRLNGVRLSHATVMRRIHELGKRVFYFYPRTFAEEEKKASEQLEGIESFTDIIVGNTEISSDNIYLSIDFDVLDPRVLPAVGNPHPGGITYEKLIDTIAALTEEKNVVAVDYTEYNPLADPNPAWAATCSQILIDTIRAQEK
ncbi:MAG: agmatinase [Candidatus Altiarchaeales archaeon]|nr:agmatinase [Candidatus Altiarchaeales archaeon]